MGVAEVIDERLKATVCLRNLEIRRKRKEHEGKRKRERSLAEWAVTLGGKSGNYNHVVLRFCLGVLETLTHFPCDPENE